MNDKQKMNDRQITKNEKQITKEQLIEQVFKKYEDPELNIDVWTLGLIYDVKIKSNNNNNNNNNDDNKFEVNIILTFTSPLCPFGPQMAEDLEKMILDLGAEKVNIKVTFTPPWKPSEELKEMLGV